MSTEQEDITEPKYYYASYAIIATKKIQVFKFTSFETLNEFLDTYLHTIEITQEEAYSIVNNDENLMYELMENKEGYYLVGAIKQYKQRKITESKEVI